jgi:hypothetical protein
MYLYISFSLDVCNGRIEPRVALYPKLTSERSEEGGKNAKLTSERSEEGGKNAKLTSERSEEGGKNAKHSKLDEQVRHIRPQGVFPSAPPNSCQTTSHNLQFS